MSCCSDDYINVWTREQEPVGISLLIKMHSVHFAAVLVLMLNHQGHCFFISNPGSLTSEHAMYYVDENLTLHCHKNSPFDTTEITFKIANDPVDPMFITRINDTDARLTKPVTSGDWAETTYYCIDSKIVGQKVIYTDYTPQNATHFAMVWLNKKRLTFSWTFGMNNITYKNTNPNVNKITADWRAVLKNGFGPWKTCDESTPITCTMNSFFDVDAIVSVRVSVRNEMRAEEVTTISPGLRVVEHGKPNPLEIESVKAMNSTSVRLKVKTDWATLNFRIFSCTEVNSEEECSMAETGNTENKTLTVMGLHPNYKYTFRVQSKFNTGGFFSEDSNSKTLTMPEDVPSVAPAVTRGSFYLDRTACVRKDPTATVYIYFQGVPEEHQNGQIRHYTGDINTQDGHHFSVISGTGTERTLIVPNLDCQQGFNVSLYASTSIGHSPVTFLSVSSWNEGFYKTMKHLDLRLRVKDGKVTAEWTPDAEMEDFALLLYFCHTDSGNLYKCREAIQHVEVSLMASSAPLPLAEANMMFGAVAVTPEGLTVGVVTTRCIYDPDRMVGDVISNVQAVGLVERIEVSWEGLERCDSSNRIIIHNYEVELCPKLRDKDCSLYLVDGRYKRKNLTKVTAGAVYNVKVRANTTGGLTGFTAAASSVTVLEQPGGGGLSRGAIAGIVSAALMVCIILGTVLFCYLRDKKRRLEAPFSKSIKKSPFQRQMPLPLGVDNLGVSLSGEHQDIDEETIRKSSPPLIKQQISDDSGYEQDSPPLSPATVVSGTAPTMTQHQGPGQEEQSSAPTKDDTKGTDMLDENSFTNQALTSDQGDSFRVLESPSQEDGGSLPPYVTAANVPSDSSLISGTVADAAWTGNEQMVYFVSCDVPSLCPGTDKVCSMSPFGLPNKQSYVSVGLGAEKKVAGPGVGRENGRLLKQGVENVASEVKGLSSPSDHGKQTGVPPASKGVSDYVRLSTADTAADSVVQDLTNEDADSQSLFGEDVLEEDVLVDTGHNGLPLQLSASANITDDEKMTAGDFQTSAVQDDTELHLSPVLGNVLEEQAQHKGAEIKMVPGYVQFPAQMHNASVTPYASDNQAQGFSDLIDDFHFANGETLTSHAVYGPHSIHAMQPHLTLNHAGGNEREAAGVWSESGKEVPDPPTSHERAKIPRDEPVTASCNGYVPFSAVPGAASLPDDHRRLSATSSMKTDDSNCTNLLEHPDNKVDESCPYFVEDSLDENSFMCIADDIDLASDNKIDGGSFAGKTNVTDKEVTSQVQVNSDGYVAWQSLPFQYASSDSKPSSDSEKNQTEQESLPGYIRLDSGYVSPLPDISSTA